MENVDVAKNTEFISNLKCEIADRVYDKHYSEIYGIEDCSSNMRHVPSIKQKRLQLDLLENIKFLNYIDETLNTCTNEVINCDLKKIRSLN